MGFVFPARNDFSQLAARAGTVRSAGLHHPPRVDAPAGNEPFAPFLGFGGQGLPDLQNVRNLASRKFARLVVVRLTVRSLDPTHLAAASSSFHARHLSRQEHRQPFQCLGPVRHRTAAQINLPINANEMRITKRLDDFFLAILNDFRCPILHAAENTGGGRTLSGQPEEFRITPSFLGRLPLPPRPRTPGLAEKR
jgi:hypothetical protein